MLDYDKIKQEVSCFDILQNQGIPVQNNRCAATWRGGENKTSVEITSDGKIWCDYGYNNQGGSVLDLAALIVCNNIKDIFGAAVWINNQYNVCEIKKQESDKVIRLMNAGFKKASESIYTDETGLPVHVKEKWEKPGEKNTYLQKTANGNYYLGNTKTYLYRIPEWKDSQCVIICEGEKDADKCITLGYSATTAPTTSCWESHYNTFLAGKDICIAEDNDAAGRLRTEKLLIELKEVAKSIKVIKFDGERKGFDVTDYIDIYGPEKFKELITNSPFIDASQIDNSDAERIRIEAKEANKKELRNYIAVFDDKGKAVYAPRKPAEILSDIKRRFLGFPYKMGEKLFDIDKESRELIELRDSTDLFSWMWNKSDQHIDWRQGSNFISKKEFYSYMYQKSRQFDQVIYAPTYPEHPNNFKGYPDLPAADPEHEYFNHWINFFCPIDDLNRILLKALFASPLYYEAEEKRPLWILDSIAGAGVGKTTIAEQVAQLYRTRPMITNKQELSRNFEELTKKLLSTTGRSARVVLVDNVIGKFDCDRLSDLITQSYVSGKPAYGHGEETRPNNLTYILTSNSAAIGNDIASRSITIHFTKPPGGYNPNWLKDMIHYRETYRYHIFADMLDIIKNNEPFEALEDKSFIRFPRFERLILQPFCGDLSEYYDVVKMIQAQKDENNIDKENAAEFEDRVKQGVREAGIGDFENIFISRKVLKVWYNDIFDGKTYPIQSIDNWFKQGFFIDIKTETNKRKDNERGLCLNIDNPGLCDRQILKVNVNKV